MPFAGKAQEGFSVREIMLTWNFAVRFVDRFPLWTRTIDVHDVAVPNLHVHPAADTGHVAYHRLATRTCGSKQIQ